MKTNKDLTRYTRQPDQSHCKLKTWSTDNRK